MCRSLFFNKVTGLRPAILLEKRLWHRCFSVNSSKFLRVPFFTDYLKVAVSLSLKIVWTLQVSLTITAGDDQDL